jgi:coproporphyrinogen III oxidase
MDYNFVYDMDNNIVNDMDMIMYKKFRKSCGVYFYLKCMEFYIIDLKIYH